MPNHYASILEYRNLTINGFIWRAHPQFFIGICQGPAEVLQKSKAGGRVFTHSAKWDPSLVMAGDKISIENGIFSI